MRVISTVRPANVLFCPNRSEYYCALSRCNCSYNTTIDSCMQLLIILHMYKRWTLPTPTPTPIPESTISPSSQTPLYPYSAVSSSVAHRSEDRPVPGTHIGYNRQRWTVTSTRQIGIGLGGKVYARGTNKPGSTSSVTVRSGAVRTLTCDVGEWVLPHHDSRGG